VGGRKWHYDAKDQRAYLRSLQWNGLPPSEAAGAGNPQNLSREAARERLRTPTEATLVLRRFFTFLQFLDQRVDPLGGKGVEQSACDKTAIAVDCGVETFALFAHSSPRWIRREQTHSQSTLCGPIRKREWPNLNYLSGTGRNLFFSEAIVAPSVRGLSGWSNIGPTQSA
jgi:hypothetical protein